MRIEHGDCLEVMQALIDEGVTVQSCVTDPPYGLQFMGREWDKLWRNQTKADQEYIENTLGQLTSRARKLPDYKASDPIQMQCWHYAWASLVYDLLPPGGYLLAFGGTRTYHRMVCAVEDAGFEIRDQIGWLFGSGFPKSRNIGNGWGTALKPAWEPIVVARKPFKGTVAENVMEHGTGALNVDGCRVATDDKLGGGGEKAETSAKFTNDGWRRPWMNDAEALERQAAKVRANVQKSERMGRWPANVIHDGSEEVLEAFKRFGGAKGQSGAVTGNEPSSKTNNVYGDFNGRSATQPRLDTGTAARFFYSSKADKSDRLGSKHPTVKPVDLMAYLCRLVTPPGGTVLDPFAGSGSTGMACLREGFECILIEREAEYIRDIKARMEHVKGHDLPLYSAQPDTVV